MILPGPSVVAVAAAKKHRFSKGATATVTLLAGLGVADDAHCGANVQHLYDKARNPARLNLRQVHLIEQELLDQLKMEGYAVEPGQLGENITTHRLNLLQLEVGTVLQFGANAQVRITGLRKPCVKIDRFQHGLQEAVTVRRGGLTHMKGAAMGMVIADGTISVGDIIRMKPRLALWAPHFGLYKAVPIRAHKSECQSLNLATDKIASREGHNKSEIMSAPSQVGVLGDGGH